MTAMTLAGPGRLASGGGPRTIGPGRAGPAADVPGRGAAYRRRHEQPDSLDHRRLPRAGPRPGGRRLARAGFDLIIDARDAAALDAAAGALRAARRPVPPGLGATVTALAGDVTQPAHRAALAAAARAAGRLDLLVNNASTLGASPLPALADYPLDELRAAFEINVLAPLALIQLLLPLLRAAAALVLNVTSDAAVEAYPGWGGYGSAKAALDQLDRGPGRRGARAPSATRSTRATCAPTCTSWPSPARTSRTGRSRSRSCPALLRLLDRAATERPVPGLHLMPHAPVAP